MATPIADNQARWSLARIAALTHGELVGDDAEVCGVVTDSRRALAGNLFVALSGERFDAHRFLADVWARGAAAIVRKGTAVPSGARAVFVQDPLRALGDLAADHRQKWSGRLVGVTGSAGKTTTKELTATALEGAGFHVLKTRGNLNNRVGVPMTLFELEPGFDAAVIEMGTSEPGEIARLASISKPDVGVVTLVALAHAAGLGSIESVADEKGALLALLPSTGVAIANGDDPFARAAAEQSPAGRRLFYGRAADCDVRVVSATVQADLRTRCELLVEGEPFLGHLRLLGDAAALNAAAALSVVLVLAPERLEQAWAALEGLTPPAGRMSPISAPRGVLVLDDSYNANPKSMELALCTAAEVSAHRDGRFVAILGDMLELGDQSATEHRSVAQLTEQLDVDRLVVVGEAMADGARAADVEAIELTPEEAVARVPGLVEAGDLVLVKASRSVGLDRVVAALTEGEGRPA